MTIEQEPALDDVLLKPLVENALTEDLGRRGDVTSQATIQPICKRSYRSRRGKQA